MRICNQRILFSWEEHKLPDGFVGYAQSPQVLVLEDRVRIFFSARVQDGEYYLSHVLWVDVSLSLDQVIAVASEPVIELGGPGTFDEHGIFPFHVMSDGDLVRAYTCGWSRRKSVSVETGVGYAESEDLGKSFKKKGAGPILSASLHEPFLVGDAFVRKERATYHMWYMFGTEWKEFEPGSPDRIYKIGHTTSANGVDWEVGTGTPIIPDKLHEYESMALPTVIESEAGYHMIFCYRESHNFRSSLGRGYQLGYAVSSDLEEWVRCDDDLVFETVHDWESNMRCYPHLFKLNGKTYLLYNGNQFGKDGFAIAEVGL